MLPSGEKAKQRLKVHAFPEGKLILGSQLGAFQHKANGLRSRIL